MTEQEFQKLMKGMEDWKPPKLTEEEIKEEKTKCSMLRAAIVINVSKLLIVLQNLLHEEDKQKIMNLQNKVLMEEDGIIELKAIEISLESLASQISK